LIPTFNCHLDFEIWHLWMTVNPKHPEHLKVTTRLAGNMVLWPVAGLRPRRAFFSLTQNFPKPLTKYVISGLQGPLMHSSNASTISLRFGFGKPHFQIELFDDVRLCQCHRALSQFNRTNFRTRTMVRRKLQTHLLPHRLQ
jgi:hypothetical protein